MNIETGRIVPAEEGRRLAALYGEPYVPVPRRLQHHAVKYSLSGAPLHGRGALARWARQQRARRKRKRRIAAQARKRNRR